MTPDQAYEAIRGSLRTGDIILCAGHGPLSSSIAAVTKSPWTHSAMVRVDHGRVMIFEAVGRGVHYYPMTRLVSKRNPDGSPHYSHFRAITPTLRGDRVEVTDKAVAACLDAIGLAYDVAQIGRLGISTMLGGRATLPDVDMPDKFICSALVSWAYRMAGEDLVPNVGDFDTTPAILNEVAADNVTDFIAGDMSWQS